MQTWNQPTAPSIVSTVQTTSLATTTISVPTTNGASNGSYGPYTVVDADSGRPIRFSRFGRKDRAFSAGDEWVWCHPGRDYRVLDMGLKVVVRPHG